MGSDLAEAAVDRVAALTTQMLGLRLFGLRFRLRPGRHLEEGRLADHLEYMIALESRGVLFASGPLSDVAGSHTGDGLAFLRAADAREAEEIASGDPFVVDGIRDFEIFQWAIMEGSISVRVGFSSGAYRFT